MKTIGAIKEGKALEQEEVRCVTCQRRIASIQQCGPGGRVVNEEQVPLKVTKAEANELLSEPRSAWGVPRDEPVRPPETPEQKSARVAEEKKAAKVARSNSNLHMASAVRVEEAALRDAVLESLEGLGVMDELGSHQKVWRLAHILRGAQRGEPGFDATALEPLPPGAAPVLKHLNGILLAEGLAGAPRAKGVAAKAAGQRASSATLGGTVGLSAAGYGAVAFACGQWPSHLRREAQNYVASVLVAAGAATPACVKPTLLRLAPPA